MKQKGYWQSRGNHTLFTQHSKQGNLTALLVYVDDIIVIGNDIDEQQHLKENLA